MAAGKNGYGTVFQITPAGGLTTLHTFTNGSDGSFPTAGLVQGADGQFYGAAHGGGTNGYGTVFRINASGALKPLYSFKGGSDGAGPSATLALGNDGNFYGVCDNGNSSSEYGTIFKITAFRGANVAPFLQRNQRRGLSAGPADLGHGRQVLWHD